MAGPIGHDEAKVTNLPWLIKTKNIETQARCERVSLINDFQAVGYGIEGLEPDDLVCLQQGESTPCATRSIIGAGTGLGEGLLIWDVDHYEAHASEGGHVNFAPADEVQIELLRYWSQKLGSVSYEQLVSGPGLVNIFEFVCHSSLQDASTHPVQQPSQELLDAMAEGDKAEVISRFATNQADELASQAMEIFINIYGAQAGNLALTTLSRGGVYIAGGIAPKILGQMKAGEFIQAFCDKGKMQDLMPTIPVHVVVNSKVGLIGAALVASRM